MRASSSSFMPSAACHSFVVGIRACASDTCFGSPTAVQTIRPWFGFSAQKSTPLTCLSAAFTFSSTPSGITSPWQNHTDFWWKWSVDSFGVPRFIGQSRVTGT